MILYNVGDSHTVPGIWCTDIKDHYWYQLGTVNYGCKQVVNESWFGRSNSSMIQYVTKHCLETLSPAFYIINITTIFRFDLIPNKSHTLHEVLTDSAIGMLDFETVECTLYSQLIGLMELLKARGKEFLIINNGKNFSDDVLPMRDAYVDYFKNEPRILNWFDNSKVDFHQQVSKIKPYDFKQYSWNGHDGPDGHTAYYKMLCTRLPN